MGMSKPEKTASKKVIDDKKEVSVENRLNSLKETSSKLQQRLENIAKTLHFPNDPKPSAQYFEHDEIEPIECCDPNFIEPIQCQKEINRVNSIFDKLQKPIEAFVQTEEDNVNYHCIVSSSLSPSIPNQIKKDAANNNNSSLVSMTESYTMSMSTDKQTHPLTLSDDKEQSDECGDQSITNKLLLELQLLQSIQNTASKLKEFEEIESTQNEQVNNEQSLKVNEMKALNEIKDLEKQQSELMSVLNEIKMDIEYVQNQKKQSSEIADKQIELIKNTGFEMAKLIKETQCQQHEYVHSIQQQQCIQNKQQQESQEKNMQLIEMSNNILSNHQHQNVKEQESLHQTLKVAMNLLDKYSQNIPSAQCKEEEHENEENVFAPKLSANHLMNNDKVSMLDRMMKDFQNNEEEEDDDDDDVLSDYTKSSLVGKQLKSETTQYSEFANIEDNVQENDNYSDDGFDSPTQQIAGTKSTISAFTDSSSSNSDDSMTEIEFDDEQPQE